MRKRMIEEMNFLGKEMVFRNHEHRKKEYEHRTDKSGVFRRGQPPF